MQPFENPVMVTRPIFPDLSELNTKLEEIWDSKWLSNNGRQHQKLEESIKKVLKVPNASLFNNGTIALIVAVQSLRLSGEVITTPFTFPATPHVLTWNNIKPIFCDIDPTTLNIDVDKIESMITPLTTGILPVHVFGTPCDVFKIQEIADRYGLKIVYDAAHAFMTEIDGKGIGNFGDITMFSFHPTKLFHTGEGGALVYEDDHFKQRIDLLKNFGIKSEDEVIMPGINGKMNEIQAALGLIVLDLIEEERSKRQVILKRYTERLSEIEGIFFHTLDSNIKNSLQYFVVQVDEKTFGRSRDYVYDELKKYNVFARKYFYPLCSDYACYRQLPSSNPENLPNANSAVKKVLSMPFYGELTVDDVDRICDIIQLIKNRSL
ncbi:DegT/DnrJ/EryC1/StrS aminotransferase [Leptonema illini DSM 21528]|uniref:DegT/DnrJ/EryC1/StrS aminotransferase n=2 Tax=Leptonema illini TaxID=183 RepID=H2CD47_9LEPT|nr:DegT/DnrJ/EryC1/StrS aminotransferase [Leptonema illini DSM 21528]